MPDPEIEIDDPLNGPTTNVLDYGGKFYICAQGTMRKGGAGALCSKVWAKVYGAALPETDPTQNPPFHPDPAAIAGYVIPNSRNFTFYGSNTTAEPSGIGRLIEVADPAVNSNQHLYIWGQSSFNDYAQPDHVAMNLAVTHHTNAGDTVP